MKNLDELVELAKKATPGKWWIDSHGHTMVAFSGEAGDVEVVFATDNNMGPTIRHDDTGNLSHWRNDNDATFIAAANPETVLALIARIKALDEDLLALRKALSETAVYEAEINGVMSSVTKSHYEDCKKYGVKTRELIVKPILPQ